MRRRNLLRRVSAVAAIGLAGCTGDGSDGDDTPTNSPSPEATPTETATAAATESPTATTVTEAETDTRSETDEPSGESTPSPSETATATAPETATATETPTETPTATATQTETATATSTGSDDVAQVVEVGPDGSLSFSPEEFTIETGDTVRWTWDSDGHNVRSSSTPGGSSWSGTAGGDSETYDSGHTYEHEFTVAGDYEYYCNPHRSIGMTGAFTVE